MSISQGAAVVDEVTTSMRLGTRLLTDTANPARYVQLIDGGLWTDEEGIGYDSHSDHVERQGTNLLHSLKQLAAQVNEPGEDDEEGGTHRHVGRHPARLAQAGWGKAARGLC